MCPYIVLRLILKARPCMLIAPLMLLAYLLLLAIMAADVPPAVADAQFLLGPLLLLLHLLQTFLPLLALLLLLLAYQLQLD